MSRLDLVAGPNGAGKSTFVEEVLRPSLPQSTAHVNADEIAKIRFGEQAMERAREAQRIAEATRDQLISRGLPLIAETVFSHPSKLELLDQALAAGYYVRLHVLAIPAELAVHRVRYRVAAGGHDVPTDKILQRWDRLWPLVAEAIRRADRAEVWDNSAQHHTDKIADVVGGLSVSPPRWPPWTPPALRDLR